MASRISVPLTAVLALALGAEARADVEINSKPTQNMSCSDGVCTATAQKAVLNVSDVQTMLASGDVAVRTGTLAKDIDIDQPLTWASTSRLTLDAQQSVVVNKQVSVTGTGALTIVTNDGGGKKGEFIIVPEHGSVQFWDLASSLIIDGKNYTLVGDIKTLAVDIAANPSGFYALARPYDASGDGLYGDSPIATVFVGVLEGLGNDISHFSMQTQNSGPHGLLSEIGSAGKVRDFAVLDSMLTGGQHQSMSWGILAGENDGVMRRCHSSGEASLISPNLGGLVGHNRGLLEDSYANTKLTGNPGAVGGLVGFNDGGTVSSSYALGSVALRKTGSDAGGLVGYNDGLIENSFARTRMAAGKQEVNSNFGGLVGENYTRGQIKTSYAAGNVSIKSSKYAGGLIGEDDSAAGSVETAYWDLDMGINNPHQGAGNVGDDPGITGVTDAQLKSGLPEGFDSKVWGSNPEINNGYPYLRANLPQ